MPRKETRSGRRGGSKPGERRGGRQKGQPNKLTEKQLQQAEEEIAAAKRAGRKLAKDVLDDFMTVFAGMAAAVQPTPNNQNADKAAFIQYAQLAMDCAAKLAPYQSPTFRTLTMQPSDPTPPMEPIAEKLKGAGGAVEASKMYARFMFGDGKQGLAEITRVRPARAT